MKIAVAFLLLTLPAQAANCTRYGDPAVCLSAKVESEARDIVLRECPRCDRGKVDRLIYDYRSNRGPAEHPSEIVGFVMFQLGLRRFP